MTATVKKLITTFFLFCLLLSVASAEFIVQEEVIDSPNFIVQEEQVIESSEFIVSENHIASPDFSTYSSSSISTCACASTTDYIVISNPLSYEQSFSVYSDNDLISLPTVEVVVSAGSSLSIPYTILVPCNERSQSYDIFVQGLSQTKKLSKNLLINQCQNLKVEVFDPIIETGICQEFISTFRVENTGTFAETYTIDTNHFKDYVSVTSQQVTVPAQSYADIAFQYQFGCSMDEKYILSYDVFSEKSDVKARITQDVHITDTYDFSLEVSEVSGTCIGDQSYFEIIIENNNDFMDFYTIHANAPGFVDVQYPLVEGKEAKTLILNPNSQTKLGVHVTPNKKRDGGTSDITVSVFSKYAQTSQSVSTNVSVYECYAFDDFFANTPKQISSCGGDSFSEIVEVTHEGFGNPVVELVSSNEMVSFDPQSVEFNGQESKNVSLDILIPHNLTSRNVVTLSAVFRNTTVDEKSFNLFTDTVENCYMLSPVKDHIKLYEHSDYFSVPIQNVGERDSLFSATTLQAPAYASLLTSEFDLDSGRRTSLLFEIDRVSLFQEANTNNNGSIIGLFNDINLVLSHNNPNVSYQNNITVEFVDYPWYIKTWNAFLVLNVCLMIFFILALLVIIFGIIGIVKTYHHEHFRSNNLLALIFLIVFLVVAIYVWFTFGPPLAMYSQHDLSSSSTTVIRTLEDNNKVIDLSSLFFDPDNNLVEFGVADYDENILNYTLTDSYLTLIPQANWHGNTTITVYVVDEYNATAVSPEITIEILPVEEYTLHQFFERYCKYINLAVLFFLLLVVYISFSFHPREKEQQLTLDEVNEKEAKKSTSKTKKSSQKKKTTKTTKKSSKKKKAKKTSKKTKKKAKKSSKKKTSKSRSKK